MQSGSLSSTSTYRSRVMVNGVARPHASWDVSRDLSGDLPEQVTVLSGITPATGTIEWARGAAVSGRPLTPFGSPAEWLPSKGDRVEIWEGDGATEWRVFTGVIDSTTGDTSGAPTSRIVDDYDRLDVPFRHEPLQRVMPPRTRAASAYRGIGLTHLYFVDAALRAAGFYALPPAEARQAVSVPAQSSMWPEAGVMVGGGQGPSGGPWANVFDSVDGVCISNVTASYSPVVRLDYGEPVRLSMVVDPAHSGSTTMLATWGADSVVLAVAASRTVVARLNGTEVCRIVLGAGTRVSLHIDGAAWELRTDRGVTSTGTASKSSSSSVLSLVTINADAASRVAGFHVAFTSASTRWDYTAHVPSARYDFRDTALLGVMDASPSINTTSAGLLDQVSQATLTAMWIDEHGVFRWSPSQSLTSAASVREVTTADDVLSLPWRDDLQSTRSRVLVKHRLPACTRGLWDNILWHQGGSTSMESGQVNSEFIEPPADEDWVGDMAPVLHLGESGSGGPASAGWGSMVGGVIATQDTESIATNYASTVERLGPQTWKVTHQAGSVPAGAKLELRYPSESTTIWPRWWKSALPIFRGWGRTQWADIDTEAAQRGPAWAPVLEHDLGVWINSETSNIVPQRLADILSNQTRASSPVITGMGMVPDPRLQLGDIITIRSDAYIGATFLALITSIRNAHDGVAAQDVQVRLLAVSTTLETYSRWNAAYAGTLTYEQFAALSAMTYQQFAGSED